jgi:predicted O-linked N-acetylglucosamine transferase (SPINDLY family)
MILADLGRLSDTLAACDAALQSHPDWISVQHTRAIVLRDLWRLDDALAACETVLRLQPKWVDAQMLRGNLLTKLGRADEAVATYRLVMQLRPEHAPAHTNHLMALHYREPTAEGAILAAARDFGRHFDRPELHPTHSNSQIPQRRLRIGYVSGDFCHHPVAYFLLGVLAHHDRTAVEVHGYKTQTRRDDFTDRLEACVEHWTTLAGLDDEAAAAQIRADGIDILVDLSGHTAGNRLLMFARRPAPVQVTWIGYSGTTGLATMDYILADRHVVPEHQAHNFTEQVWRLPNSYLCFTPLDECSEIQPSTAATTAVVFGSFNNLAKLSPQTVVLWATLLHRVPDSQLILKHPALSQQRVRREVLSRFAAQGVDFGRLQLLGFTTRAEHFALYQRMDIALDPTPYGGTTTTAEALWMGKPVVTLSGETWVARVGESILTTLGLPELIARTEDDYLAIGASLAADVERRTWLTNNLRRILSESPFGDAAGFTRDLEAAYRGMWRRYCDTKNPQL